MSQENVELVVKLLGAPGQDLVPLFRDDHVWAAFTVAAAPFFHPDFECVAGGLPDGARTYIGLDGFRAVWRDWMAPWATYRTEIDETVDLGDRVFVLLHDFARLEGTTEEVQQTPANIWTVHDGKIARAEFYVDWRDALQAFGWDGQAMSQENVEAFNRAVDAFDRQDFEAMLEELDAAVEWYDAAPMLLGGEATVYRGHEGVRDLWRDLDDAFEARRVEYTEIRDLGGRVLATGRLHARGKGSGAEVESPYGIVCDFENGKAIRVRTFLDVDKALQAAGLSE